MDAYDFASSEEERVLRATYVIFICFTGKIQATRTVLFWFQWTLCHTVLYYIWECTLKHFYQKGIFL